MSYRDHECNRDCLIMIVPCAKYDIIMPMSKQTEVTGSDTKTCKNPYKFDLDVKDQCIGIMNTTLCLMVMHVYGMPMSKPKKLRTENEFAQRQSNSYILPTPIISFMGVISDSFCLMKDRWELQFYS